MELKIDRNLISSIEMFMHNKIGIIVPVYKTEKYVAECIESVLNQSYSNLRLILVDDGSPDEAGKICDSYALKDDRITVVHQNNLGVIRARANGVQMAYNCDFIMFVDSDDKLPSSAILDLYSLMSPSVNIVCASHYRFYNDKLPDKQINAKDRIDIVSSDSFRKKMIIEDDSFLWSKLYRKSILNKSVFDMPAEIVMGEDTLANIRLSFLNDRNVIISEKCVYYYRQHNDSCMHTFKRTAEYEQYYYETILNSLSPNNIEKYRTELIMRRILTLDLLFGYSSDKPKWIESDFFKILVKDIHDYKYRKQILERLLLCAKNPNYRSALILLKRIKNKGDFYKLLFKRFMTLSLRRFLYFLKEHSGLCD